ncbi:PAS domain-containing protein [Lactobacillus sp. ESL0731]|uniref:PAS domain-containing protein n=1 Tax=unclassified Lactobacillus TaxID=2620435 RepID=UPI0023F758AF|nr:MULTISPECIES: PAS domain-containing protein [unclassified Lactobacillus]WEV50598.1 PAS domain-containing protein [Lactobacillus sp. ESL0700]WEV61728.1 PAS domain-containing protein [Lactobacillus sp. ESL0731]
MDKNTKQAIEKLAGQNPTNNTVNDVAMTDDDWLDKAAEKVNAVSGDTYVKLKTGLLTVNQLEDFLNAVISEMAFVDENNQFLYFNDATMPSLANRKPKKAQLGNPLGVCHPEKVQKNVAAVVDLLKSGKKKIAKIPMPTSNPDEYFVHYYCGVYNSDGEYRGVNEQVFDMKPLVDWYLKKTGQKIIKDPDAKVDTYTGATSQKSKDDIIDAISEASPK